MLVKICGVTSEEDALLAVAMGADALGFVFAPSTRQVAPSRVADIVKRLPHQVITVGVFRDETPARVVEVVNRIGLRAAQLHGHESPDEARWVRARVPATIKAFPAGAAQISRAGDYGADAILLDGPAPGSGKVFDWRLAEGVPAGCRLVVSGGLDSHNVAAAAVAVRAWGVDVSSGVEASPGRKDARLLRDFVAAVRAVEPNDDDAEDGEGPFDWSGEI